MYIDNSNFEKIDRNLKELIEAVKRGLKITEIKIGKKYIFGCGYTERDVVDIEIMITHSFYGCNKTMEKKECKKVGNPEILKIKTIDLDEIPEINEHVEKWLLKAYKTYIEKYYKRFKELEAMGI